MWHLRWTIIITTCFSLSAEVSSEYSMDRAMVEFAKMDRELSHYVKAVQSTINHVSLFTSLSICLWLSALEMERKSKFFSTLDISLSLLKQLLIRTLMEQESEICLSWAQRLISTRNAF